ncbi:MAG: L,D-transpeptidase family protein [Proteobacteria bacterium]|nr:L,D-transpeptidase family protein [Pseudomonadota bacterium]
MNQVVLTGLWISILAVSLLSGCKKSTSTQHAHLQRQIQVHNKSMDEQELNRWIASTQIVAVSDIHTNRTAIIHNRVHVDSWNSMSGRLKNNTSITTLGVFSIHAIHYCPVWLPMKGGTYSPCADNNLLGSYAAWFKEKYLYGIHGRPETPQWQSQFQEPASERYTTSGCIAAPADKLDDFMNLIFSHQAMGKYKATIEDIQKLRSHRTKEEKEILIDVDKQEEVDIKLLVINTKHWPKHSTTLAGDKTTSSDLPLAVTNPEDLFIPVKNTTSTLQYQSGSVSASNISILHLLAKHDNTQQNFQLQGNCNAKHTDKTTPYPKSCHFKWQLQK